jgi:2-iminobutanoate/2-iminopropanoate deaminase
MVNNTLYTSGQIALNPENGELIMDSIESETTQVMKNLEAILKAADMTFENVIKSTIFIMDMNHFGRINRCLWFLF